MWGFLQGIVQNLLADALVLALATGGVIAWMKKHASPWLIPVCWGLGAAVVILIGAGALRFVALPFPTTTAAVTTDNVESQMKDWLERFGFSVQKMPENSTQYFSYIATNPYNRKTVITRYKQSPLDIYLTLSNSVTLGSEDAQRLQGLSAQDKAKFTLDVAAEMARQRISFKTFGEPLSSVEVEKGLPITASLTEATFVQAMDDMDSGQLLLLTMIPLELSNLTKAR